MTFVDRLIDLWLAWSVHPVLLGVLAGGSLVVFVLGLLGVPWVVARLPADHFARERTAPSVPATPLRMALRVLKNIAAVLLLLAGVAMLVLPGQGLLTLLVGLALLDVPGKRRAEQRILRIRPVRRAINALRRRAGREPLILDPPRGRRD